MRVKTVCVLRHKNGVPAQGGNFDVISVTVQSSIQHSISTEYSSVFFLLTGAITFKTNIKFVIDKERGEIRRWKEILLL